jgi:Flp pilus assembly protein TadD
MKKRSKIIITLILSALSAAVTVLYLYEVIHDGVSPTENLPKFLIFLASFIIACVKIWRGGARGRGLAFYEAQYPYLTDGVYAADTEKRKKLITAIKNYNENRFDRAISALEELRTDSRYDAERECVGIFLGLCYTDAGMPARAIAAYEWVRENVIYQKNADTLNSNLGILYRKMGEHTLAETSFLKAIECNPNNTYAHNNLSIIYYDRGEYESAKKYAERALELTPNMYQASGLLSIIYYLEDDRETSEKYFRMSVLSGQDPDKLSYAINNARLAKEPQYDSDEE